jgi:hypothetical protein
MASFTEWELEGVEFVNCSCDCGCPCQFNSLPTHGHCHAHTFVHVARGRYGNVRLDGLDWGILAAWPGPIHLGNGTFRAVIDERANTKQRAALEAIAQGRDTEPGALIWQVFSTTVTNLLPTIYARIDLSVDLEERSAALHIAGVGESTAEPIRNRKTGAAQQAHVTLPAGFEFTEAEFASGTTKVNGDIPLDFNHTHAHLARIHWSTHGVVR